MMNIRPSRAVLGLFMLALFCCSAPGEDAVYAELAARSYPSSATLSSLFNPWGERLEVLESIPADFGLRVATAAKVYADQGIRFDGYLGSDDDGSHYYTAADGKDGAYYGDEKKGGYRVVYDGKIDDVRERVWVCLDYAVHALTLAGFPLREAMTADFHTATAEYTLDGTMAYNLPVDDKYFRRVDNLRRYFTRRQFYSEDRVTQEQYRDPGYRPRQPYQIGDVLFMGHYKDADKRGPWAAKHSGIVASVDERGLPVSIYNMRVSVKMIDDYDGVINHTRTIAGKRVFFKRFSDRYSLIGHGRVIYPFTRETVVTCVEPDGKGEAF